MKKLGLGCLLALFAFPVAAYETVPLAGDNYSYVFNIYHNGENTGIEDEGKIVISPFDI